MASILLDHAVNNYVSQNWPTCPIYETKSTAASFRTNVEMLSPLEKIAHNK